VSTGHFLESAPRAAPQRLIVQRVTLRDFRSYAALDLELSPGLVLVVGPNGAGKTNLLEALHVGTQGFSPRTRTDAQLIRFGADAGRIALHGERAGSPVEAEIVLRSADAKRAKLNGASLRAAEQLRSELATLVFTPDRLAVVKGGPAVRRAYFDRALGRLFPARALLPAEYAAAVGQRNAALRRVSFGASSREALEPWTQRVAQLGAALVGARSEAVVELGLGFRERATELGLQDAEVRYAGEAPSAAALEARLEVDLERGTTGLGPHLDDFELRADGRELRRFGSQGEQRLAVLALLLGEAELLAERGSAPPLLLLDDVLSELDDRRRAILAERIGGSGQALVTSTSASALPGEPAQLVQVVPGSAS
jgi:DNA replication and repair protein RecF